MELKKYGSNHKHLVGISTSFLVQQGHLSESWEVVFVLG